MTQKPKIPQLKGILLGEEVQTLYHEAQSLGFAVPAVNVSDSHGINAALEAACEAQSPLILQISYGGAVNFAGQSLVKRLGETQAAIAGALSAAKQIWELSRYYRLPIVLHTDHAPKARLAWLEGVVAYDEAHFRCFGRPLFSSHMIDFSREPIQENIEVSCAYFKRMAPMGQTIEIEVGATGGEEDGIRGPQGEHQAALYSRPEEVCRAYEQLSSIGPNLSIAATFGNVHGVYHPGNVKLNPELLQAIQRYVHDQLHLMEKYPLRLVFHGSSGSRVEELQASLRYGVVKVNVDTDLQWAQWEGVLHYYQAHQERLQSQVGTKDDSNAPNKAFYDPRAWLRASETSMVQKLKWLMEVLGSDFRLP